LRFVWSISSRQGCAVILPPDLADRIEQAPPTELPALIGQLVEA
jgi:hypothetical protein